MRYWNMFGDIRLRMVIGKITGIDMGLIRWMDDVVNRMSDRWDNNWNRDIGECDIDYDSC